MDTCICMHTNERICEFANSFIEKLYYDDTYNIRTYIHTYIHHVQAWNSSKWQKVTILRTKSTKHKYI